MLILTMSMVHGGNDELHALLTIVIMEDSYDYGGHKIDQLEAE